MAPLLACWALPAIVTAAAAAEEAGLERGELRASSSASAPPQEPSLWRLFARRGAPRSGAALAGEGLSPAQPPEMRDDANGPIPLSPPRPAPSQGAKRPDPPSLSGALTSMIGGLAVVLGLFFLVVWFARRAQPGAAAVLPSEVVELLGRAPLSGRQQMHLVRFGGKLLLLSVTPTGAETLSEIADADEVHRLSGICQQNHPGSITKTFRHVLYQLGGEPAPGGFVGESNRSQLDLADDGRDGGRSARGSDTSVPRE
jgi:flagellar biogenesis protein FliO